MKALVVYDSQYANTEHLALTIAAELGAAAKKADEVTPDDLSSVNLLVVGSPTQGGKAMPSVQQFVNALPDGALRNVHVAAFDTRFAESSVGGPLRILMKLIGYAAPKINAALKKKGGNQVATPEGFIVKGKEGPLSDGELERARSWAKHLAA